MSFLRRACIFLAVIFFATPGFCALDLGFDDPTLNGEVSVIATQGDRKILIGGQFTQVGSLAMAGLARLNADGTHDTTFVPAASIGQPRLILVQVDGKIVVGGTLGVKRFLPDGQVDSGFLCTAVGGVWTGCLQSDGRIVIAGGLTSVNGTGVSRIARLNTDGTLDSSFAPVIEGATVYSLALQSDGKILVGGSFTKIDGVSRLNLARLLPDGQRDAAYNPSTNGAVRAIALENAPSDLAYVAGDFTTVLGQPRSKLALIGSTGALVNRVFPDAGFTSVRALAMTATGVLYAGGQGPTRSFAGFAPSGTLFNVVTTVAADIGHALAIQYDGGVLLGGSFQTLDVAPRPWIGRLTANEMNDSLYESAGKLYWARTSTNVGVQGPALRSALFESSSDGVSGWLTLGPVVYSNSSNPGVAADGVLNGRFVRVRGLTQSGYAVEFSQQVDIPNRAPLAKDVSVNAIENREASVHLLAADFDQDILTYEVITPPTKGTLSGTGPDLIYLPNINEVGPDSFRYRARDGKVVSNEAVVSITIARDQTAPVIVSDLAETEVWKIGHQYELGVQVNGGSLEFQWSFNGKTLAGKKSKTLVIDKTVLASAGIYQVEITNDVGTVRSCPLRVYVSSDLLLEVSVSAGSTLPPLNALLSGPIDVAFTRQWMRDSTPVLDVEDKISGSTSPTLRIRNASVGDSGIYTCVATTSDPLRPQIIIGTWKVSVPGLPPVITDSTTLPTGIVGSEYLHQIQTDQSLDRMPSSFTSSKLPAGLVLDTRKGTIRGRPLSPVTGLTVEVTALNAEGSSEAHVFSLTILPIPRGTVGTYVASVGRATVNGDDGGRLDLVTTAAGTFTAKLDMQGLTRVVSGRLSSEASAGVVSRVTGACRFRAASGRQEVFLTFELDAGTGVVSGVVSGTGFAVGAQVIGYRNRWSGASGGSNPFAAYFTSMIQVPGGFELDELGIFDPVPQGSGHLVFNVHQSGTVSGTGRMCDGTPFTLSSLVGPEGQLPGFYWWNKARGGSLTCEPTDMPTIRFVSYSGDLSFDGLAVKGSGLSWRKGSASRVSSDLTYPQGFPRLPVELSGAVYSAPSYGQEIMDFDINELNASIRFYDGGSTSRTQVVFTILNTKSGIKVEVPKHKPDSEPFDDPNFFQVTFALVGERSGLFSGTFNSGAEEGRYRPSNYMGVIVRDPENGWIASGYHLDKVDASSAAVSRSVVLDRAY